MRRLFWICALLMLYVWAVTSNHDHVLLEQGRKIYDALVVWFSDAEVDFQWQNQNAKPKKSRRWD